MLEDVFTDLYNSGVLFFLDTDNYIENTVDMKFLKDRQLFIKNYSGPITIGYIYTSIEPKELIIDELQSDSCAIVDYAFESDTDEKTLVLGELFVDILVKHKYLPVVPKAVIEDILARKCLSIVITAEDIIIEKESKLLNLVQ
jgi:hypothetical protein